MPFSYRNLLLLAAQLTALIAVPAMMLFGYLVAGQFAALRIGIPDFPGDYLEAVVLAVLLLFTLFLWPATGEERRALLLLWLIRVGVALGAMLPYEALYEGLDASFYYHQGRTLGDPLEWINFGDGTSNMIAICAAMWELTDSYNAMKLVFAYVGLISVFVFYRAAAVVIGQRAVAVLYVLGMFPSILFWSSILGKDPLVLLGIAVFSHGAAVLLVQRRALGLVWLLIGVGFAASFRVWLGVIFIGPLVATMVLAGRAPLHVKFAFMFLSVPVFLLAMRAVSDHFAISSAEDLVARTDTISQAWAAGGSAQAISGGFGSLQDMLLFIPYGSFAALFRPLPGEIMNPFGLLAGAENGLLLALLIYGLFRNGFGWLREPVLLWAVLTLMAWASIYGFASYQNLGSAFRFRAQVGPILVLLIMLLCFWPLLLRRREEPPEPRPPEPDERPAAAPG